MKKEYMSPELTLLELKSPVMMASFREEDGNVSATDEIED